jgi:hypothetical protein
MIATSVAAGLGVVVAGLLIGCPVVCAMKGKWWVALLGFVVPVVILAWPVCAVLVAKPGSFWARRFYDDYWMMKAEDRFSKKDDPELQNRLDAAKDRATGNSRKPIAAIGGLVALLLVAGGIITAVSPTSRGGYTAADRSSFVVGCEKGEASASVACHCELTKAEAAYHSNDELISTGSDKRAALARMFSECSAPKGKWELVAQNDFVAHCSAGKPSLASECGCVARKVEVAYSGVEVEAAEASHDARYETLTNKWLSNCESPKAEWNVDRLSSLVADCAKVKGNEVSWCRCVFAKEQAAYPLRGLEALEEAHDARVEASIKRFGVECARSSSPARSG